MESVKISHTPESLLHSVIYRYLNDMKSFVTHKILVLIKIILGKKLIKLQLEGISQTFVPVCYSGRKIQFDMI